MGKALGGAREYHAAGITPGSAQQGNAAPIPGSTGIRGRCWGNRVTDGGKETATRGKTGFHYRGTNPVHLSEQAETGGARGCVAVRGSRRKTGDGGKKAASAGGVSTASDTTNAGGASIGAWNTWQTGQESGACCRSCSPAHSAACNTGMTCVAATNNDSRKIVRIHFINGFFPMPSM